MHDTISPSPDLENLYHIATGQMGYFTATQADESGVSRALLHYHAKTGKFERVFRGVYRFRDFPSGPREEVVAAWLAVGRDVAVVSHESALDLLGLTDVIPDAIDLTVPRSMRYLRAPGDVTLHTTARPIGPEQTATREGIRITSATRTIIDVAECGLSEEHVRRAVEEAMHLGLSDRDLLRDEASHRGKRVQGIIERAIENAAS